MRRPDKCDGYDPTIACSSRRAAQQLGAFWYDERRKGYCCSVITGAFEIPVLLDACCFCWELLPGPEARRKWEAKYIFGNEVKRLPMGDATAADDDGSEFGE